MAISPSAVEYPEMRPEDVALLDLEGRQVEGNFAPSSEWEMHLLCYLKRPDVGAVVHTHSLYATVLACLHQELPPVHYTVIRAAQMQMGVAGDNSWGARTHEEYLLDVTGRKTFTFSFEGIV